MSNCELGILSAKYESSGNPGIIANNSGDPGGKSYGAWQFNSKDGIVIDFYKWTKNYNNDIYTKLNTAYIADGKTNGKKFDLEWKKIANEEPNIFLQLQHEYTKEIYYDAAASRLLKDTGFDINKQSFALQNVLWSTAVQHGVGGCVRIFKKVDIYFRGCSQEIKNSVYNRLKKEKSDALKMLNGQ